MLSKSYYDDKIGKRFGLLKVLSIAETNTKKEQARNSRSNLKITIRGRTKSLAEWCEIRKFSYMKAYKRLMRGWQHNEIFKLNYNKR